jgi:hypothetical protein
MRQTGTAQKSCGDVRCPPKQMKSNITSGLG